MNYSDGSGHFPILCTLLFLGGLGALTSIASQAVTDIMYGNEFDINNYLIAAGTGFIGGLCYAIPGVGEITLQNSVINQLMSQLIVREAVTGTISNMFGSIFQEIPSRSSDYYHLRKMGLNPWDSFRYAFF